MEKKIKLATGIPLLISVLTIYFDCYRVIYFEFEGLSVLASENLMFIFVISLFVAIPFFDEMINKN